MQLGKLRDAYDTLGVGGLREALARGGDVDEADVVLGVPLLCWICAGGDIEAATLLLDAGADIDVRGPGGWTPLVHAANGEHIELVKLLLQRGADRDWVTEDGYTAFGRVPKRNLELARLLAEESKD